MKYLYLLLLSIVTFTACEQIDYYCEHEYDSTEEVPVEFQPISSQVYLCDGVMRDHAEFSQRFGEGVGSSGNNVYWNIYFKPKEPGSNISQAVKFLEGEFFVEDTVYFESQPFGPAVEQVGEALFEVIDIAFYNDTLNVFRCKQHRETFDGVYNSNAVNTETIPLLLYECEDYAVIGDTIRIVKPI